MSMASNRATGVPRSVTTTSSPARARSIHVDNSARKVLIATSMPQMYNNCIGTCTSMVAAEDPRGVIARVAPEREVPTRQLGRFELVQGRPDVDRVARRIATEIDTRAMAAGTLQPGTAPNHVVTSC